MILTRIQIENYKQYQGVHEIELPEQAVVGVIGENGTGKTTLFEAIEWCLYSPRSISPGDVRPRGYTGHTSVTTWLETSDGREQYIVQRVLKRTPSAAIYRIEEGEPVPFVQGTRQVSEFVATRLIGLAHAAFTATFFTRQKELHLFGSEPPAKRREAVGRMLGLETIRTARRLILDERSAVAAEARAMRTQYERESSGRDFPSELAHVESVIDDHGERARAAASAIAVVEEACHAAEQCLHHVQERRDASNALDHRARELEQERGNRTERAAQIETELQALGERERERATLAPIAARVAALASRIEAMDLERVRFERREALDRRLEELAARRAAEITSIRGAVSGVTLTRPVGAWQWSGEDDHDPVQGADRLVTLLRSLDVDAAERREAQLRQALDATSRLRDAEQTLDRYRERRKQVEAQAARLIVDGEPKSHIPEREKEREDLLASKTALMTNRATLESERDKARRLLRNLNEQQFGEDCPTCGRPFSAKDAAVIIGAMRARIDEFSRGIEQCSADVRALDDRLARNTDAVRQLVETQAELDRIRARIQNSTGHLEKQAEEVDACRKTLQSSLDPLGLNAPPAPSELDSAGAWLRQLRDMTATRQTIANCRARILELDRDRAACASERATLQDVSFDPDAYRQLRIDHQQADRAQTTIAHIDLELKRRDNLAAELVTHRDRLTTLRDAETLILAERTTLAYDPAELPTAQAALKAAQAAVQRAHQDVHLAQSSLREAETRRDLIQRERDRLDGLAKEADARQSEADYLDLMTREFTEFERFAAARKVPILNELTSVLVERITNGKYQRVEFDQDFGIVVFDGDDGENAYPVETFSGGERDAIVLAARLALSQMIGRQAANPPGFLVLDEVFGSLDTDRREHALGLLGTIANTFDDLRQVFIISHVDDVRTSPVLDELWRVEETPEGGSQVTVLSAGAEIEAL